MLSRPIKQQADISANEVQLNGSFRERLSSPSTYMIMSLRVIIIFSLLIFPAVCQADAGDLFILTPPDNSSIAGERIDFVFSAGESSFDAISLTVNGRSSPADLKSQDQKIYCLAGLKLDKGHNTIAVTLLKNARPLGHAIVNVFRRSKLSQRYNRTPFEYSPYNFHVQENEKLCLDCHSFKIDSTSVNPPDPEQSICFQCHKHLLGGKYVHGPASVWGCLNCHDLKATGPKYHTPLQSKAVCERCHEDVRDSLSYAHGPVAMGMCTVCHNPHSSGQRFFLRMAMTDLCSTCHEDTANRPHLVLSFSGKGHPVALNYNPYQPGTEFSCASCHNPHGGSHPLLLKNDNSSMRTYCTSCHKFL